MMANPGRARAAAAGSRWPRHDRGQATAELAVGLPALMVLTMVAISAVTVAWTAVRCQDAAREAARAAARGDSGPVAGARVGPPGATVQVARDGRTVRATVRDVVHPLVPWLPGVPITAVAVAALEPQATWPGADPPAGTASPASTAPPSVLPAPTAPALTGPASAAPASGPPPVGGHPVAVNQ
jgi:TadE-like protein